MMGNNRFLSNILRNLGVLFYIGNHQTPNSEVLENNG
ncbi:hypothetical protein KPSA3_02984 [Pseudomonas syringae pv. actinidiae]|uniref:Uncharacterized protein n=1 Tax=Pseudomonas syringae pv. actinidiae TaxID=103796 RepID=A0AAN4TKU9_PSESF|nr:hypothetical protein KPSA3_02984 [Pseudomonas syringae pv. actinidiae]